MEIKSISIPSGTPLTQAVDNQKFISRELIKLLPLSIQKDVNKVCNFVCVLIKKHNSYLEDFMLPSSEKIKNILDKGDVDIDTFGTLEEDTTVEIAFENNNIYSEPIKI